MTTFFKISAKCTNFEVSSVGREFKVSGLGLGIFDEVSTLGLEVLTRSRSWSRRLRSRLHHCHHLSSCFFFWMLASRLPKPYSG